MENNIEYKCPCCGGEIVFDSTLQKMKCPYCGTEFDVATLKDYDEDLKKTGESSFEWQKNSEDSWQEEDGMKRYICASCGGEIICEETVSATSCPYCGNPQIISEQLSGELKPDCIIPFYLDKKAAKAAFEEHLKHKKLLPKVFKTENHIDEIKGIYVPFWLFNADSVGTARFTATSIRMWSDRNYDYTETTYYSVIRKGNLSFDNIPADGSKKMANDLTESLEPFDFSKVKDFQTAYLSGYFADKYDVCAEDCTERVNARIRKTVEENLRRTVIGYNTVHLNASEVSIKKGDVRYALFPVWLLNTTYRGEKFIFAMNGQSGKMVGNLPLDRVAYMKWLLGIWAAVSVAAFFIMRLFGI